MIKKTPQLYWRLLLLGLISIVVSMTLSYALISDQLTAIFVDSSVKKNSEIADSIATFINDKLKNATNQLRLIDQAIDPMIMESTTINALILQMNAISNTFIDIEVIDINGIVLFTLPANASEIGFDRSREEFFTQFDSNDPVYWSSVQLSPYSNSNTIAVTIRSRLGYLVGYLDLKQIQALSEVFISQFGDKKDISITDRNGIFLVNKDNSLVEERRLDPHHEMALKILNGENMYVHSDPGNVRWIITSSLIENTLWMVSITESYGDATAGITTIIRLLLTLAGFVLTGYALLLWRGSRRIINDIKIFSKRLSAAAQGDEPAMVNGYFQEFETLHESFSVMTEKIADRDRKLTDLAYHDALTGFYNRSYLDGTIVNQLNQSKKPYAVAYIDLDNFSHVNDSYGHHVGDQLLIEFSKALALSIKTETQIIRLGGDEFILIIRSEGDVAVATAQTMRDIMTISNEPIKIMERNIYFTMSTGISFCPQDGTDFWTLLRNADTAMYAAKSEGKNKIRYFTLAMNKVVEEKLTIEQYLRPALKNKEFRLEFQPQLSVDEKQIRGFEALIRWDNPVLGLVNPIDFIGVAEENRSIIPIGHWVMKTACEKIKSLNEQHKTAWIMAVNVSPIELREPNFAEHVLSIIKETGIDPKWLEIEITENISIDIFALLIETLEKLHDLGISISIDDFGTGYSSLAYLQKIPLDVLKVDRSFIIQMDDTPEHSLMTETIFLMSKKLGLLTVAEGVESRSHIDQLQRMNCDFVQGYFISRPLTSDRLDAYLEDRALS